MTTARARQTRQKRYRLHWASGAGPRPQFKWVVYDWAKGSNCPVAHVETRAKGTALCAFLNALVEVTHD